MSSCACSILYSPARARDVTEENLQARLRGVTLMALSNKWGALVLTTGNKSELAVGYCTLYGDMCGGLAVISDVPKTLVYELSRIANRRHPGAIPESVFEKPPSAELRPDQKDSDSLPPYEILDQILRAYVRSIGRPGRLPRSWPFRSKCRGYREQSGSQRVQTAAGRAGLKGDHKGVRHRPRGFRSPRDTRSNEWRAANRGRSRLLRRLGRLKAGCGQHSRPQLVPLFVVLDVAFTCRSTRGPTGRATGTA